MVIKMLFLLLLLTSLNEFINKTLKLLQVHFVVYNSELIKKIIIHVAF